MKRYFVFVGYPAIDEKYEFETLKLAEEKAIEICKKTNRECFVYLLLSEVSPVPSITRYDESKTEGKV